MGMNELGNALIRIEQLGNIIINSIKIEYRLQVSYKDSNSNYYWTENDYFDNLNEVYKYLDRVLKNQPVEEWETGDKVVGFQIYEIKNGEEYIYNNNN